jgi:hypothetical protein
VVEARRGRWLAAARWTSARDTCSGRERRESCGWVGDLGSVWFVANYATLCLRLIVRIEQLTLGRKVRQSVASEAAIQTCL